MIDKKGKLFGKINIIDLIAIILIIAAVLFLGGKFMGHNGGISGEGRPVTYVVKARGVQPELFESLQKETLPQQLVASGELMSGYLVKVEGTAMDSDTFHLVGNGNPGEVTVKQSPAGTYDVLFTVEATIETDVSNTFGTQEIRIGRINTVKTQNLEVDGIIVSVEDGIASAEG